MIQVLILYINTLIVSLDVFEEITGLCEIIEKDQNGTTISFPAQYCDNGEYKAVEDYDISKGVVYHRLTGNVTEDEIESTTGCETNIKKTYPIRTVGVIKKDILKRKNDNNYIDDKIAGNIANSIAHSSVKSLMSSLKAEDISISVSKYSTNRYEIWNEEHKNIPMGLDFEYVYFSVDYSIIVEGSTACFDIYGCDTNAALVNGTITITNSVNCDQVADCMDDRLIAGSGVTLSYNDTLKELTISSSANAVWGGITGTLSNQTDLQAALNAKLATASFTDAAVTGKLITGYVSGAGTIAATDTILQAIQKLNGNDALAFPLTGGSVSGIINANGGIKIFQPLASYSGMGLEIEFYPSGASGTGYITSINRTTSLYQPIVYDGISHKFDIGGTVKFLVEASNNTSYVNMIFNAQTASTVPYLNASKELVSSAVTPTELGYVSGVTSAIQTQINNNKWTYSSVSGSDATTSSVTLVNVTGLSNALLANTVYEFEAVLMVSTSANTDGIRYGVDFSGAGATIEAMCSGPQSATGAKTLRISAFNTQTVTFMATASQTGGVLIKGVITVGANAGNLTIQHLKLVSGTSTVFIASFLKTKILI